MNTDTSNTSNTSKFAIVKTFIPSVTTSLNEVIAEQEKEDLMRKVNTLPKTLITIIKMVAALATKRKSNPELEKYIHPQVELLTNLVNIKKNPILDVLKSRFQEMLKTYIVYMDELVKDVLDYEKYTERHDMLVMFNEMVKTSVQTNTLANLYDSIF
jgi:hypothetical protein